MFKISTFTLDPDNYSIVGDDLVKTASLQLPDGMEYDPDFLYLKVRAVSAGEYYGPNKNLDFFPEAELKKQHPTFLQAHVFKNHENKKIEGAIGDVLASAWNDKMKGVDLYIRIDRKIAPNIVRGFEKGIMTDVSMGCRVKHSKCPICGNTAKRRSEFCDHIKYERGVVYDDGRQVYEINIEPRFHDISTVKTGAEHAAKALGIYIENGKVAFHSPSSMEKTASVNNDMIMHFSDKRVQHLSAMEFIGDMEKIASFRDEHKAKYPPKKRNKGGKLDLKKVASLKKEITGHVIDMANEDILKDNEKGISKAADYVKFFHTDYWTDYDCNNIGRELCRISALESCPKSLVFSGFLKGMEYAGMSITPLELHNIRMAMKGQPLLSVDEILERDNNFVKRRSNINYIRGGEIALDKLPIGTSKIDNIGLMSDVAKTLGAKMRIVEPANMSKALTSLPANEVVPDEIIAKIMESILKLHVRERAMFPENIGRKAVIVIRNNPKPIFENVAHFAPVERLTAEENSGHLSDEALSALLYGVYQKMKFENLVKGATSRGMIKFASCVSDNSIGELLEMEKEAMFGKKGPIPKWGVARALAVGVPATYAYSGIQRARMEKGKDIGTINTYIARNPGNAAVMQLVAAPGLGAGIKKMNNKINHVVHNTIEPKVESFIKNASEDIDIFKDGKINDELKKEYSKTDLEILKLVCIMESDGRSDEANDLLAKHNLAHSDVDKFLETSKEVLKEKIASEIMSGNVDAFDLPEKALMKVSTTQLRV